MTTKHIEKVNGFLNIGDQHLSHVPPGYRKPGYAGQVLRKINAAIEICNKNNLVPLFLGDMFNSPIESSEAIKTVLQEILSKSKIKPLINTGNHDIKGKILSKSDTLSVIAAGGHATVVSKLTMPGEEFLFNVNGKIVAVGMSPYGTDIPDDLSHFDNNADMWIWMTHHDLAFEGAYPGSTEPFPIKKCNLVLNGHMHGYRDPIEYGNTVWCNFGAIARTSRDLIGEIPSVFEITPDEEGKKFNFSRHRLPFVSPDEAFNMVGKQVQVENITASMLRNNNENDEAIIENNIQGQPSEFVASLREEMAPGQARTGSGQIMRDELVSYMREWKTKEVVQVEVENLLDEAISEISP
jgi:DNA repair exonuclease SbcCD nuclease subunit